MGWEIDALMLSLINVTVVNDHCTFLSSVYNGDDNAHHKRKEQCTFLSSVYNCDDNAHHKRTFRGVRRFYVNFYVLFVPADLSGITFMIVVPSSSPSSPSITLVL
jgi:hypothetical protein